MRKVQTKSCFKMGKAINIHYRSGKEVHWEGSTAYSQFDCTAREKEKEMEIIRKMLGRFIKGEDSHKSFRAGKPCRKPWEVTEVKCTFSSTGLNLGGRECELHLLLAVQISGWVGIYKSMKFPYIKSHYWSIYFDIVYAP